MDASLLQQTMMNTESCGSLQSPMQSALDPNVPINTFDGLTINGTEGEEASPSVTPPPAVQPKPQRTYDELFPALPGGLGGSSAGQNTTWNTGREDMRIQSSNIMHVFHVPLESRAKVNNSHFGESTSHSICADITKRTGARIEISSCKDNSLSFLVSGKADMVPKAKKLILEKFQAQNTKTIKVPKEHHKLILGKKGARLRELETSTSTKITVPSANDPSESITIVGSKEGIESAGTEISMISDEQLKHAQDSVTVPKMYHPFITGGNNANVNMLNNEYGVRINVPPNSVNNDVITIIGEKEAIAKVKSIIQKTHEDIEEQSKSISVEVNKSQHKFVVGPKGSNIAEIMNMHGVSVEVPPQDAPTSTITLRGPPEKLGTALNVVYEKAHSQIVEEVKAPMWLHRYIIGKKGANINKITEEFPQVHIELDDAAERIKLDGPRAEVQKVRANLNTMIEEMLCRIKQETITVDPKYHKHIIGKSGSNINRIRNETNVFINFDDNTIKLEGAPDAVDSVKKELYEVIKKLENEKERDIHIDSRLHGQIIGSKGEKIREIRDQFNQVQIVFPEVGQKSDVVKIRGPKEEVDACFKYMQKFSKQLLENNYQIKVTIFKQLLKYVIGKGGANINKIRMETDVRIDLSSADAEGVDEMTIIGKKENCEKAKALIEAIQSEVINITEVEIIIPAKYHNSIIGQGGKLIRSISEECGGVYINFPSADKKSDKVSIRGPKEEVAKAKKTLIELSNERQLSGFSAEVRCKLQHHKFLIGRNGATIKKMRETSGARIIFPSDKDEDKDVITIIGKKEQVANAKKQLEATIAELDNIIESTINIPPQYHVHFVQRRAEVLRQLADEFGGVRISFPKSGEGSEVVTLKGSKDCVVGAKERMQEMVLDLQSQVTEDVFIPQHHHRTVMGPRGSQVQDVIKSYNVKIKFPDRSEEPREEVKNEEDAHPCDYVRVTGSADKVAKAKAELLALVPVTDCVEVAYKFHSNLIGQRGANVRNLMNSHHVNIQIPPAADQCDTVRVTGRTDDVASAIAAIKEQVENLLGEEKDRKARNFQLTLNVDPQFHPKLIGKKGATISKIRDKYGVNIRIPDKHDEDPTLITVIGYEEKCVQAKEAIINITGELASQVKLTVNIPNSFHARLIGQKGRNIRRVMETYRVMIAFPGSNVDDPEAKDIITVTGPETNCLDCQDHLLNQLQEYRQEIEERSERDTLLNSFQTPRTLDFGATLGAAFKDAPAAEEQQPDPWAEPQLAVNGGAEEQMRNGTHKGGFVVPGAPWTQEAPNMLSRTDFPSMGASGGHSATLSAWGPKRS